jgi:hypothetical protein
MDLTFKERCPFCKNKKQIKKLRKFFRIDDGQPYAAECICLNCLRVFYIKDNANDYDKTNIYTTLWNGELREYYYKKHQRDYKQGEKF